MLGALRLWVTLVQQSLRAQMEYRASFALKSAASFLLNGADFALLWALFQRFDSLGGFRLAEVAIFYGIINGGMAFADAVSRGLDNFGALVKSGDFDRTLLRPQSPLLLLLGQELTLRRLGRLAQAWIALGWGLSELGRPLDAHALAVLVAAHVASALVFLGLWILQAALCFFTVETLEAMHIFTYGGAQLGQAPLSIYSPWLRRAFTAFVPVATVVNYPGLLILGREAPLGAPSWFGYAAPLAGPVFFGGAVYLFGRGVRRYTSTGS